MSSDPIEAKLRLFGSSREFPSPQGQEDPQEVPRVLIILSTALQRLLSLCTDRLKRMYHLSGAWVVSRHMNVSRIS